MKYIGMEFETVEDIKEWSKDGNINYYRKLAKMFSANPNTELSAMMSYMAEILVKNFNLTWAEIEELEIA